MFMKIAWRLVCANSTILKMKSVHRQTGPKYHSMPTESGGCADKPGCIPDSRCPRQGEETDPSGSVRLKRDRYQDRA